jgi:hypothetical protein
MLVNPSFKPQAAFRSSATLSLEARVTARPTARADSTLQPELRSCPGKRSKTDGVAYKVGVALQCPCYRLSLDARSSTVLCMAWVPWYRCCTLWCCPGPQHHTHRSTTRLRGFGPRGACQVGAIHPLYLYSAMRDTNCPTLSCGRRASALTSQESWPDCDGGCVSSATPFH